MSFVVEDNIIKGEDIDFDFAELGGLGSLLFRVMKKNEQNLAQISPGIDRKDTYGFLLRQSVRTAIVMKYKGIEKGDIVLGCADNHMDASIPLIASLFLGAIPCNMDPALVPLEITNILSQIKPKLVFTIPEPLERIKAVCRDLKLNPEFVVFGESRNHTEFQTFVEKQTEEDEFKPIYIHDPKETAIIYFSSGTSGLAKACCLPHVYFMKQIGLVSTNTPVDNQNLDRMRLELSKIKGGVTFASYSPPYWITWTNVFFGCVMAGLTRLLCKKFDPKEFWHLVEKYRVSKALLWPVHISELLKHERPASIKADSLIMIIISGSSLPKRHWKLLQELLPNVDINQTYGSTETGTLTAFEMYNKTHREMYRKHPDSVGFPVKAIWYKVVNPETGEVLGPNQEGELLVKSKYFMNGYYNQPLEASFDKDGWFRTGDVVYYTESYAFFITDRLKELMKYRQMTVYPNVIENELLKHPAVYKAVVLGVPHEEDGDRPAAVVILNDGFESVTADQLRDFVNSKVQDKAKLRGGVRIVKEFPMTSTGKVRRIVLRKMILEE